MKEQQLADFVGLLAQINRELKRLADTGDLAVLGDMHATVKGMYAIQHENPDDAFRTIDPDCEVIYRNFDLLLSVLRTVEGEELTEGERRSVNRLLHNINQGVINIVTLFGLA